MPTKLTTITAEDFASDQEVRWCPGCGDFAILAQIKQVLASLRIPREKIAFVSGVGCSSRLPYYLNVYGFHTLSGRAPTVATGLKVARPDLSVWVATGDGDGLGAGSNYLLHALRRNVGLKILLFNNEVYGLSKGQSSPTTRPGTRTRTTPHGSTEQPLRPLSVALAAEASFVARTIDVDGEHLAMVLRRAAEHAGAAFVEIYQNCKIFNDGVFDYATDRAVKSDNVLYLEHGKPLVYGKDRNRGIRLRGASLQSFAINGAGHPPDLLVHDEQAADANLATMLAGMTAPNLPEVLGVLRCVERPTFEERLAEVQRPRLRGAGTVEELFASEDSWEVA